MLYLVIKTTCLLLVFLMMMVSFAQTNKYLNNAKAFHIIDHIDSQIQYAWQIAGKKK